MRHTVIEKEVRAPAHGTGEDNGHSGHFRGNGGLGHAVPAQNTAQLGLWALLATLTMLFAGFTSAYLVRRTGSDWQPIAIPPILWLNTAVLLTSSLTLLAARKSARQGFTSACKQWLGVTTGLGILFLLGQMMAWRYLSAQGIYLPTSPHSSFFYMLTAVHGLHVLGGLAALSWALVRVSPAHGHPVEPTGLDLCATYWHFVDGLWIYLLVLLWVW